MARPDWLNLNGLWEYAVASSTRISPDLKLRSGSSIDRPSGVRRPCFPTNACGTGVPGPLHSWQGTLAALRRCRLAGRLRVNGTAGHTLAATPFWFDVTDPLHYDENEPLVPSGTPPHHWQPRRQVLSPGPSGTPPCLASGRQSGWSLSPTPTSPAWLTPDLTNLH
jgi:hypothetical protein